LIVCNLQNTVEEKDKLCVSLKENVGKLEQSETDLQKQMQAREAEFNQRSTELCREVELGRNIISEVTNECEKLRLDLVSLNSVSSHLINLQKHVLGIKN